MPVGQNIKEERKPRKKKIFRACLGAEVVEYEGKTHNIWRSMHNKYRLKKKFKTGRPK